MIIGDGTAHLFDELNAAVEAESAYFPGLLVCLNAHAHPHLVPEGAVVYNQENVPLQVSTDMFAGHEVWDFSERNCATWRAAGRDVLHAPVGYHPTMERFTMRPWNERDIDVVFTGLMNDRRLAVLNALGEAGLQVHYVPPGIYGKTRDDILARSKLALSMLYYPQGIYGSLRTLHYAHNKVPFVAEDAPDRPSWLTGIMTHNRLDGVVTSCIKLVQDPSWAEDATEAQYAVLKSHPFQLPEEQHMGLARIARVFGGLSPAPAPKPADPFHDPRWSMVREKSPEEWDLGAMYVAASGKPTSSELLPAIVVPSYRESERVAQVCRISRNTLRKDLQDHGFESMMMPINGDSLICRMRQRAMHIFLMSEATHLLFWDADIECVTPDCLRAMMATGHDVIAGACPFKDESGRTVHNLWDGVPPEVDENGCVEVRDAGTGFMLISRSAILALMKAHPELLHWSMSTGRDRGAPLWALFDTGVVDQVYQSEDYMFCHLWQQLGGKVYVYAPARFRHWGEHGFEASFIEQYGLAKAES